MTNFRPMHAKIKRIISRVLVLPILLVLSFQSYAQPAPSEYKDILFAKVGDRELFLDLYLPTESTQPYLIVWVHGGRWWRGSRASVPKGLVSAGYAIASVDYRLSTEAIFPAQVHDIKAAIRFLRAHAQTYGYRTDQIIIWGGSAGGHLAALVGTTNENPVLEGDLGDHLDQSSSIQVILDFFGPTNLLSILEQSTLHGYKVRAPALALLLGGDMQEVMDVARMASPVHHVDPTDPPILIVHGDQDIQVPINQAHELEGAYEKHGLHAQIEILHGAGHGGDIYRGAEFQSVVESFLSSVLEK